MATDQDPKSLEVNQKDYSQYDIHTIESNIVDLYINGLIPGPFDLISSAGLFDYLAYGSASRLTQETFHLLKPGGILLIANVMPSLPESAYMETFMDWTIIYGTAEELRRTADLIPANDIADIRIWADSRFDVAFLEIKRA